MKKPLRSGVFRAGSVLICLYTLAEVNYPLLSPQGQLALFALMGLGLCFLNFPLHCSHLSKTTVKRIDAILTIATLLCFAYVFSQVEPRCRFLWLADAALGDRAGAETTLDVCVGLIGLMLVLEAARRAVGPFLPALAILFLAYAAWGNALPDGLLPHRGYSCTRIASQTFLQSQGVFGVALRVMFTYVFLFVLFGATLETVGATRFVINVAHRLMGNSVAGPAKIAVLSSGLMGSLSGSAVANTATTGTFTIPLMRAAGFRAETAAGVEAAASAGGALVPPVMGAGAYMMLEMIDPPVTYLAIIRAAIVPALLYYSSLVLVVHLLAHRLPQTSAIPQHSIPGQQKGVVFIGAFVTLIVLLLLGYTPARAVSIGLGTALVIAWIGPTTRPRFCDLVQIMVRTVTGSVALVAAACCVGTIVGVVTLTGVGAKLPGILLSLAEDNSLGALVLLMISTVILSMGLPSAVCYLLVATLVGPVLGNLAATPMAGHFFIFYFGMMSMVTPPVALAAYTAAAIAGSPVIKTALEGFRFASVGFALPFAFVLRPELLLLGPPVGGGWVAVGLNVATTLIGIATLACAVTGHGHRPLSRIGRVALLPVSGVFLIVPLTMANLTYFILAIGLTIAITWRPKYLQS